MANVHSTRTGDPVFPFRVESLCMSEAEALAKAAALSAIRPQGYIVDPTPDQEAAFPVSAWELEHADGAFCGSASSQTLLAPAPAPEFPPQFAPIAEAQMVDAPDVASLTNTDGMVGG